jgi:hypothetical protein
MNRVAMILGAGIVGMMVAAAAGSSGRSSNTNSSSGHPSYAGHGQQFMKQQGALRGELTRVKTQQQKSKGNTNPNNPNKGKFDPNKVKFDPNKGKFDPNKGKLDANRAKLDFKKGDPFIHMWGRGMLAKNGQFLSNHRMTGNAFKKLPDKHHKEIHALVQSKNVSAPQKAALNKINNGQQLSTQDRQALTNLRDNPPADMTREMREAVSAALTIDGQANKVERYTRFLRLYNSTDEPMKVWVQYHTFTDKNTWSWFPTAPASEDPKAVAYTLKPGQTTKLADGQDGWIIHASRVRVWGKSDHGMVIDEFRKADLVLVPETNDKGEPVYVAAEQETYTYTFAAETSAASSRP